MVPNSAEQSRAVLMEVLPYGSRAIARKRTIAAAVVLPCDTARGPSVQPLPSLGAPLVEPPLGASGAPSGSPAPELPPEPQSLAGEP
jgi:hypothetical protein